MSNRTKFPDLMALPSRLLLCLVALLPIALSGCATNNNREGAVAAGGGTVAVIGTPFYALFKAATCVTTAALVAPGAAALELSEASHKGEWRQDMNDSVSKNCGGPYVLSAD